MLWGVTPVRIRFFTPLRSGFFTNLDVLAFSVNNYTPQFTAGNSLFTDAHWVGGFSSMVAF